MRLSLLIWLAVVSLGHGATRVAVVTTCGGEAQEDVLALVAAKLSQQPDLVVVERSEVERVLAELKLTHCGPSDSRQAVTTGRLLGVEVFASLETMPQEKRALGLVVFDAASGVRLSDSVLPAGGIEAAVDAVVVQVRESCEKRRRPAADLRPVCLLSIRNADLPREMESWCQSVGIMLRRRLVQSPSLAVLERERLEHVNKERQLPADAPVTNLFSAVVMVELEVGRGAAGKGIRATAFLSDSKGGKLGQTTPVTVDNENAADLSESLLAELVKSLHATPAPAMVDREQEAARFIREADFLARSGELVAGLHAIEAAHALAPTNTVAHGRLLEYLTWHAGVRLRDNPKELGASLDIAQRGLDMLAAVYLRPDGSARSDGDYRPWLKDRMFWNQALDLAAGQNAETTRKLLAYQQLWRDVQMEVRCRRAPLGVKEAREFSIRAIGIVDLLRDLEKLTPSADTWTADTMACLDAWLTLAEKFPLVSGDRQLLNTRPLNRLCYQVRGPAELHYPHINNWKLESVHYRRLGEVFERMQKHPDPVVQCYGQIGPVSAALRGKTEPTPEDLTQFATVKQFIRTHIATVTHQPIPRYRSLLYSAMLDLIDVLPEATARKREYADLFDFMLQRKEVVYWAVRMATDPQTHTYRQYVGAVRGSDAREDVFSREPNLYGRDEYPQLLQNTQRVLELYRSKERTDIDTRFWSYNTKDFANELAWFQRDILPATAEAERQAPWESATVLFDSEKGDGGAIRQVVRGANANYVVTQGERVRFIRVPLTGEKSTYLGPGVTGEFGVMGASLMGESLLVATSGGIYIVSTTTGETQRIGKAQGLPSEWGHAVAGVDGVIFAALGEWGREFFVVSYDLKTKACQVLVSSRRQEALNELDKLSPAPLVTQMFADPARRRVVFIARLTKVIHRSPAFGLWQIAAETKQVKRLVRLYDPPDWAGPVDASENALLIQFRKCDARESATPTWGILQYDLAADKVHLLYAERSAPAGPEMPPSNTVPPMPGTAKDPFLIVQGWLWFADAAWRGRLSADGKTVEYFPKSATPTGWHILQPLPDARQVIAADRSRLWLLTLPEKPVAKSGAGAGK